MRRWCVPALLAVVVLLGGTLPAAAVDTSTEQLSEDLRAWVEANEPVVVGWSEDQRPVAVVEDGRVTGGYNVDVWSLAAARLGVQISHVAYPDADALAEAFVSGDVDIVGGLRPVPAITEVAQPVSTPWAQIPLVFVGRADDLGAGVGDLTGRTVSGRSSPQNRTSILEAHPGATYVDTAGPDAGLAAVAAGELDLYFGPLALLGYRINQLDLDLVPVGQTAITATLQSWARVDSPAAALQEEARAAVSDSDLALLHVLWTGFDLTAPDEGVPAWLVPALLGLAVALAVALLFVLLLRRRVRAATSELRVMNAGLEDAVADRTAELGRSAERLRRSNAALKRFTATAAHDLKGPLTAITGLADVALQMDLPVTQKDDVLGRVRDSAKRLGRMVDDMLADAVTMGTPVAQLQGTQFRTWLREVSAPELAVVDAALEVDVPDGPLDLDVEVLRRATINLVTNAVKYAINEQGVRIRIGLTRHRETWQLVVEDNGRGIPRAMWSEVFDRGRRLTDDDRGFGLGLAAIRDLVQGAGGSIRVGDNEPTGARFTVTLPVVEVAGPDEPTGDHVAASRAAD